MDKKTYPSFTIIVETENLLTTGVDDFQKALHSLINQDIPLTSAKEVLLLCGNNISDEISEEIANNYSWITTVQIPDSLGYYEVKSYGSKIATGDIVIYADLDCQYDSGWLRSLLESFKNNESIDIVAGETVIAVKNPYSMALAINYMLHRQKTQQQLHPSPYPIYYINNVAFKREVLQKYPIPERVPIFRGACSIHARVLKKNGYTIWKQPLAKASHATPNSLMNYLWRFLLLGHDNYWLDILYDQIKKQPSPLSSISYPSKASTDIKSSNFTNQFKPKPLHIRLWNKCSYIFHQTKIYLQDAPHTAIYLPLALPIIFLSQFLMLLGRLITKYNSHYLLKTYLDQFEPAYSETLKFESLPEDAKQFQLKEVICQ